MTLPCGFPVIPSSNLVSPLSLFYILFIFNIPLEYYLIHYPFSPMFAEAQYKQKNCNATAVTAQLAIL